MSFFASPPKPKSALGWHRILSPNAAVKSSLFGKNEDPFKLLDAYFALGGNFIDTSNIHNSEDSEGLIGQWMEECGVRDQMVIGTKYTAGFRAYNRDKQRLQSNFTGSSVKNMHVFVRESLKKLWTGLYRHLEVLYLGVSNTPAWVVVKANAYARANGLTPFSVYQGNWNAAHRDMEAEIIPICEDQGMAIVPWAALGDGQLMTATQRKEAEKDADARKAFHGLEPPIALCDTLERIAEQKGTTLQAIALAYLFHQSTYVFPIVGANSIAHIEAMPDANYDLSLTASDNGQYQLAAWIEALPQPLPYKPRKTDEEHK
ncbi:Norsolorinic acid reductase A 2 [Colletotrichum chlorophyti]|uniref:Norsolorinic acid reductase A 2 n=1 Tax=Colletotrichum chlorophyti TaxID=708187 RepID=A0A1Q8RTT6_9PEZI|nr:Norsolorinic acid reductase A 2 [Colletotrichum chlorophyti]